MVQLSKNTHTLTHSISHSFSHSLTHFTSHSLTIVQLRQKIPLLWIKSVAIVSKIARPHPLLLRCWRQCRLQMLLAAAQAGDNRPQHEIRGLCCGRVLQIEQRG